MSKNTDGIVANLAGRVIRAEVSEKVLLDMLFENGVIDKEIYAKKVIETFPDMSSELMMEMLDLNEEEFKELKPSFGSNDK